MRSLRILCIGLLCTVVSCGGDDDDGGTADAAAGSDAAAADAAAGSAAFLGQLCGPSLPACPTDYTCEIPGATGGSATDGYCSPMCDTVMDCTDGYGGPGNPACFVDDLCTIVCSINDCPTGLTCLPTGGPTNVCAVPE